LSRRRESVLEPAFVVIMQGGLPFRVLYAEMRGPLPFYLNRERRNQEQRRAEERIAQEVP